MASSPSAQSQSFTIDLHAKEMGRIPFPVLSMPIQFTSHIHKGPSDLKQERIERIYTFPLPSPNTMKALETNDRITRAAIRVTEQTSFDLDKKVWDSGIGLSSWLVNLAHNEIVSLSNEAPNLDTIKALIDALRDSLFANQPRCIIELGAGTGVVALTIATLRRALTTIEGLQGHVITTDLPSAMPLLEHNIHSNARLFLDCSRAMPEAAVLDWDSDEIPDFIQVVAKERTSKGFTAIVMADVAYNTSSFPSLVRTLSRLVKLSEKPPLILLGYKERDPAERDLWNMAKDVAGIDFSLVGTKSGMRDPPIEIWIGQVMND
ncbi:hypothetical protein AMATHDRAFT_59959 [Amanita thiersii Skay4041]|uniref:Methyltransferase-domain-containing protein n=1 Tax=Amanita thiersii Skay4041 TaxID=703135 RepID=A0A2A9NLR3_9AGAR|nr:hypothetical protein AMATHDRAFT_59959 [Amanita thiersii Skay4041]